MRTHKEALEAVEADVEAWKGPPSPANPFSRIWLL